MKLLWGDKIFDAIQNQSVHAQLKVIEKLATKQVNTR